MTSKRLPDDPEYWEGLAQRVERAAWERREGEGPVVLAWLAERVPLMAAAALAAAAVLLLAVRAAPPTDWAAVFAPRDTLGRQVSAARPPSLAELMASTP